MVVLGAIAQKNPPILVSTIIGFLNQQIARLVARKYDMIWWRYKTLARKDSRALLSRYISGEFEALENVLVSSL